MSNSSSKQIGYFLSKKEKAYSTFNLPKKNGSLREISAPAKPMKYVQRWILDHILYKLDVGDFSHGFVPGKSIVTNASIHVNQDLVLGIDLKDFFPNIQFNSVRNIFKSAGYSPKVASLLADICTHHRTLPQGAPTSPTLSNLVALKIDEKIDAYCAKINFKYSRYADDITISGGSNLPKHKQIIIEIIEENGFIVNEDKTRMFSQGSKQKVTGLVVNDKVSIGRKRKKNIRATVHNILKNGPEMENRENNPFFKEKIFGELAFVKMVDPDFANPLIQKLKSLDWINYNKKLSNPRETELVVRSLQKNSKINPETYDQPIDSEGDFLQVICDVIAEMKLGMERQKFYPTFWNEESFVILDGTKHKVSPTPKIQSSVHKIIFSFIEERLLHKNIQTIEEFDEEIKYFGFKFLFTTQKRIELNVSTGLELAHDAQLENSLTKKLPSYMETSSSKSGLFIVMWFKDKNGIFFEKPTNKSKSEMVEHLEKNTKEVNEKDNLKIESILIDVSNKSSASKISANVSKHRDFSTVNISHTEKRVVKIIAVQLAYELSTEEFPPQIIDENRLKTKVLNALAKAFDLGADIVCLPELCVREDWIEGIQNTYTDMVIVAGSYYDNENHNVCKLIVDSNISIPLQMKITPSPFENPGITDENMVPGSELYIYNTKVGKISILICRDFLNLRDRLRGNQKPDIIFIPSYNSATERFYDDAHNHTTNSAVYIVISNTSLYGGTSVFGLIRPESQGALVRRGFKDENDRQNKLCKLRKGEEGFVIADFNLIHKSLQNPMPADPAEEIKPVSNIDKKLIEF
ncbi:retron St85 family RNA-directed DNA polymerase [Methanococcoides alaskense]|uniref:Retron-type reverse transcriptase n=1 Tax=Methanococcoides alaskense TaxID=325778 RepID=A0AA90TX48_9EURY|nr:retron St85 family RNA-directed DNA polymerase [Methanococcoides alaskense]MDA0525383.1 retron St85 family RNA-directed DNA polymerase [Methanococcoides alaskense]MDR6221686.1 retron-type reverse transcriptase [Methanococcoides alaskense]